MKRLTGQIALAGLMIVTAAPALAQDFKRVVPKLPPAAPPPTIAAPDTTPPIPTDQAVLVPELKAVVFVSTPDAVRPDGVAPETVPGGVSALGLPLLTTPDFKARVRAYLGKPLTHAGLETIAQIARDTFRAGERPFLDVSVPQQKVESGVVQLLVTEYRLGEINVTGNRYFLSGLISGMGDLQAGEPLTLPRLRKALDDYNQNPFLTVSAVARPGGETGLTDLTLEAKDRLPLRVYGGYDNQGTPLLGRDEWYVGGNWGNVFGTGQILSYQFTRSFKGRYTSHSASDVVPIGPDDRVLLFGAYAIQKPDLGPILDSTGRSGQVSGRWAHDLPGSLRVKQNFQFGIDYKRTDNNLDFLGFRILKSAVELFQFSATYSGTFIDHGGRTVIELTGIFSPGDATPRNDDASLNLLVPFSDATYGYARISATRTTFLPKGVSWIVRGMFQAASGNLPYSEQLGGGGIGSVRGYDPNTALGSEGVLLSTELRSPAFSLLGAKVGDQLQLGVFLDYARLWQPTPFPDLPHSNELASVGFNINYSVGRFIDLQLQVGSQLIRAPFEIKRTTRAAVIATIGF